MDKDVEHLLFMNPFLDEPHQMLLKREYSLEDTTVPGAYSFDIPPDETAQLHFHAVEHDNPNVIFVAPDEEKQKPLDPFVSMPFFFAEGGLLIAALALAPAPEERVLCACSAPGAKALVLASAMFAKQHKQDTVAGVRGRFVCNEPSKERATRLQRSMRAFLPKSLFDSGGPYDPHILLTSAEPSTPSSTMEKNGPYDKILVDVPATEDRELLRASGLDGWSTGKVKVSSDRILKWLQNCLWLLRDGGSLLYCTTALSQEECDGVVERLVRKAAGNFELECTPLDANVFAMVPSVAVESTEWGVRLLPDQTPFGPTYLSKLQLVRRTHSAVAHLSGV